MLDEALPDKEVRLRFFMKTFLHQVEVAVFSSKVAQFQSQTLEEASWNFILRASNVNGLSFVAKLKYVHIGNLLLRSK